MNQRQRQQDDNRKKELEHKHYLLSLTDSEASKLPLKEWYTRHRYISEIEANKYIQRIQANRAAKPIIEKAKHSHSAYYERVDLF